METQQDKELVRIANEHPSLESWQFDFAKYLMLPKALRPSREKIKGELNLTDGAYYYWLRHPTVLKIKSLLTKRYFHDDIPDILQALRDEAISGNERAAKVFLEYIDDWKFDDVNKPQVQILNITQVNVMLDEFRKKEI